MKHITQCLCIFTVFSLIFNPITAYAQRGRDAAPEISGDANQGMMEGRRDAIHDVNGFLWFGCGCTFNYLGVGAALIAVPSPKQYRFMGKSQDYIWAYTKQYKKTRRGQQTKYAAIGCATGTAIALSTLLLLSIQSDNCNIGCGMDQICDEWNQNCDEWNANITNCSESWNTCTNNINTCGDVNCSTPDCSEPSCNEPSCGETPGCSEPSCGSSLTSCGESSSCSPSSSSSYSSQE
jgi:hypothetical protein